MVYDSNLLRDKIASLLDISREKVMLCFSHTHSAPNISLEPDYFEFLMRQILSGVRSAAANMSPIYVAWDLVDAKIGVNRRNSGGELDKRVGILKVTNAESGQLKLVALRVTAHANVLCRGNFLISSDYFGTTRRLLESELGCKVMLTQGAAGNVKPRYQFSTGALEQMAEILFQAVYIPLGSLVAQPVQKLIMQSHIQEFCSDVPTLERAKEIAEEALRECGIDGTQWLEEVRRLGNAGITVQCSPVEIQYFALNDGCLCGVPCEVMCEVALEANHAAQDRLLFLGGYTNGCGGYLPTAQEFDLGGYETLWSYLIYYIYHGHVTSLRRDTAHRIAQIAAQDWRKLRL